MKYCESIHKTIRRPTREVKVGTVGIGAFNPIRVQSMTTTPTSDADATIDQIIRLSDAGCEIVRVTVQGQKEVLSCEKIKNGLIRRNYSIPLVADIHFYPPAALLVADFVDKIRINPGNFVDPRARFKTIEYDDASYAEELKKIESNFSPLVEKCKRLKKALRIGVNHGSLSDRIMNRYGNTVQGMVESALEFGRICRKMDFHDLIFSMKASHPLVMIQAYRQLAAEMMQLKWDYPLHLGVTEAGAGEDGRIKSAMGIGALLLDGLGDTIRVSLTEDPVNEVDVCRRLIAFFEERNNYGIEPFEEKERPARRKTKRSGIVVLKATSAELSSIGSIPQEPDAIIVDSKALPRLDTKVPVFGCEDPLPFIFFQPAKSSVHDTRRLISDLKARKVDTPVVLCLSYDCSEADLLIRASAEAGAILCDSLVEGICIKANVSLNQRLKLSFDILQSARMRMVKTDFISCPGCGRTLFDIQEVARKIREKTGHLPGVKIAIMGCIVNGPGEMADADFGYVGSKKGKVDLYVGKTCVERDVLMENATDCLIALIAAHGKWIDPPKKV